VASTDGVLLEFAVDQYKRDLVDEGYMASNWVIPPRQYNTLRAAEHLVLFFYESPGVELQLVEPDELVPNKIVGGENVIIPHALIFAVKPGGAARVCNYHPSENCVIGFIKMQFATVSAPTVSSPSFLKNGLVVSKRLFSPTATARPTSGLEAATRKGDAGGSPATPPAGKAAGKADTGKRPDLLHRQQARRRGRPAPGKRPDLLLRRQARRQGRPAPGKRPDHLIKRKERHRRRKRMPRQSRILHGHRNLPFLSPPQQARLLLLVQPVAQVEAQVVAPALAARNFSPTHGGLALSQPYCRTTST
jgi:hypothetical protein